MHIALIPVFRVELGLDTLQIGLMASIPLLVQAVFTIPCSFLADRIDRLKMIAASLALSAVGGVLMAQVPSVPLLVVFVSLFALSSTLIHPPALSAVGDLVTPTVRERALGLFGSAGTLGIALGPITLSVFLGTLGWRAVYLLWSVPAFVLAVLVLLVDLGTPATQVASRRDVKLSAELQVLLNLSLTLLLVILGMRSMSGSAVTTYITPYFVDTWQAEWATASLIFGVRPLIGMFAAPFGGVMVDKVGEKQWIAVGLVAQIVSLSIIAFAPTLTWLLLSYLLYAFFGLMEMPAVQSLISRYVPTGGRGLAFSLSFLPGTVMGAISPVMAAFIVDSWGLWYVFPLALTFLGAAVVLFGLLWRRAD
jgi:MFS family permease